MWLRRTLFVCVSRCSSSQAVEDGGEPSETDKAKDALKTEANDQFNAAKAEGRSMLGGLFKKSAKALYKSLMAEEDDAPEDAEEDVEDDGEEKIDEDVEGDVCEADELIDIFLNQDKDAAIAKAQAALEPYLPPPLTWDMIVRAPFPSILALSLSRARSLD